MFPFSYIKFHLFKKKFRKLNSHNFTQIMNYCDLSKVVVGKKTYGEIHVTDYSPADTKLYIGSYCSIAPGVQFLLGGEHQLYSISTYPFKVLSFGESREAGSKGNIVVKDDVWIGTNVTLLSGVHVGRGAEIGSGSVCRGNIPPYAIVTGNPAKIIGYRFTPEEVEEHEKALYEEGDRTDMKKFIRNYNKYFDNRENIAKHLSLY